MYLKFPLLILSFTSCLMLNAQDNDFKKASKKNNSAKRWTGGIALGITPLPDNQVSLLPSIEYFINDKFSVYNDVALQLNKNYHADSAVMNKKYLRYKAEFRYYFSTSKGYLYPFVGIQFTTATRKFDIGKPGKYYDRHANDSAWFFEKASVNSPFTTTSLQLGLTRRLVEELFLEGSIGYGVKFINTKYDPVTNLRKDEVHGFFNIKPAASYRYIGKTTQSHFTFLMRLCYRF